MIPSAVSASTLAGVGLADTETPQCPIDARERRQQLGAIAAQLVLDARRPPVRALPTSSIWSGEAFGRCDRSASPLEALGLVAGEPRIEGVSVHPELSAYVDSRSVSTYADMIGLPTSVDIDDLSTFVDR